MTGLLELREKVKLFYSKNEAFVVPVLKFLLAFVVLNTLNGRMGYMTKLDNIAIVLIVALTCSFLPNGAIVFFAAVFSLAHMYALSMEVALVGMSVFLLIFLLFARFSAKESLVIVLTPLACGMGVPYVMPVAMGLLGTPASAISVGCGVVIHYLFAAVVDNASTISTMGDEEVTAKIRLIVDGLMNNKSMLVMISAFVITVFVVYIIRRMSIDYSWTIAMIAGVMVDLVILLVGDLLYDTNISVLGAIIGAILAALIAKLIEFFRFCVDYSRTEKVQFDVDEYYYYVKAVPKMTVATPTKTVKRINTQTRPAAPTSAGRNGYTGNRSVTTERTAYNRNDAQRGQAAYRSRNEHNGSRSMTINSNMTDDNDSIDYDDIF